MTLVLDGICIDQESNHLKVFNCLEKSRQKYYILGQLHKSIEYPTKWGPFSEARGSANEAGIRNQLPPSQSVSQGLYADFGTRAQKGPSSFLYSHFLRHSSPLRMNCVSLFTLCTDFASCSCVYYSPRLRRLRAVVGRSGGQPECHEREDG